MSLLLGDGVRGVVEGVGGILDEIFTSDDEKQKNELAKAKIMQAPFMAQLQVDLQEASHASIFVAGARPFLKWVAGVGIAYEAIARPLLEWLTGIINEVWSLQVAAPPSIGLEELVTLVTGGLVLYGTRAVEGIKGRKRNRL